MTYTKTVWQDDIPGTQDGTPFTADRMNNIEDGVEEAHVKLEGYTHVQSTPASTWIISHNLGKKPQIEVVDSADSVVLGDVEYTDGDTLTVTFIGAFSGKAYLL